MAEIYRMPSVSPTMEVGTIVEWHLSEGESFEGPVVIADIGTDKANMEAELFDDGVLLKLLVEEGDEVPLGAPIAILGTSADEDIDDLLAEAEAELKRIAEGGSPEGDDGDGADDDTDASSDDADGTETSDAAPSDDADAASPAPAPRDDGPPPATPVREWMGTELPPEFADPPGDARAATTARRIPASPLARKVADDLGVDLRRVDGSGPGGRITRDDVEAAHASPAPTAAGAGWQPPADETVKLTPMRKTIARRLLESHRDIPTFYLTVTFDMSGMVQLRTQLKAQLPDVRVSYNDMMVAAVARALRESPDANASWTDKGIVRHGRVDVGVAVAIDQGLITPVLRNADRMKLSEIGTATRELAERARNQKLSPDEYTGGTFTISNLGMMGIDHFTAIINPPEAGILAVGALQQIPVVEDGELTVGWRMKATMTCDHRVIDGAVGAEFLATLRRYVETPALLLV